MEKHEVVITTHKASLSKEQEKFNKLVTQLDKLEADLVDAERLSDQLRSEYLKEVHPIEQEYNKLLWAFNMAFDTATRTLKMSEQQREALDAFFLDAAQNEIEHGNMEAVAMYNFYSEMTYEDEKAEFEANKGKAVKEALEDAGMDTSEIEVDWNDEEAVRTHFEKMMEEQIEAEKLREEQRKERQSKKPKSAKKQAEAVAETELSKIKRTIYMELVKRYHPDRYSTEPDKIRAGQTMQRITDAYEQGDMLTLLRLQNELGTALEATQAGSLAEHQLKELNKQLSARTREIKSNITEHCQRVSRMYEKMVRTLTPNVGDWLVRQRKAELKREIKGVEADIKALNDPKRLKGFIKTHTRPPSVMDMFEMMFGSRF